MREKSEFVLKAIGQIVLGVLVFNALSPLSVLAQEKGYVSPAAQRQLQQFAALNQKAEQSKAEKALSPADRVSRDFKQAQDLVHSLKADSGARQQITSKSTSETRALGPNIRIDVQRSAARLSDEHRAEQRAHLKEHLKAIHDGQDSARADFAATGNELQVKKLPAEILARHSEATSQFEQRAAEFERLSQAWQASGSDEALAQLDEFFKRYPAQRAAAPFDPKKLPWSTPKPTTREPATTKTAWFQQLWSDRDVRLAQAGGSVGPINFQIPPEPGQLPDVADLAQTPETQQSAAITAKANELGLNPVSIHNWVRNNIEWVPTWGAIQSAEDTLNKKRGNAHDTASLEIALLRAANIPARYQYGTIELTAEQAQNWVGGVTVPQAAQQLLGQGGIANKGIVAGGKIAKIQLEHVWVSAFVNWAPSRGAKQGASTQHVNPNGKLNAWVSLDPSYKQYSYAQGMDLKTAVPLDANAMLTAAQQGATVNAAEGWVQNLNQAAIQSQLTDYQARLKTYIDSQNPNATVGDVIGKKIVPVQAPPILAGSMPYAVVQQGQLVAAVPSTLQHKFTYKLYASLYDRDSDSPLLAYTEKTSQIVGKRMTLTYVPATQADADLITSYLPKAHADGSPIQPSEFPTSLPGYLIKLKAQINLDGQAVAQANQVLIMGADLYSTGGFTQLYDATQWDLTGEESNVVGNATAVGISAGGVGAADLSRLQDRLKATKQKLASGDVADLRGEQLTGDLLAATILGWHAASENNALVTQRNANTVEVFGLSYGVVHVAANPTYSWGVIRQVSFRALNMDVGHVRMLSWNKNNVASDWVKYNRYRGLYMSGLEHSIPERTFNDPNQCNVEGDPNAVATLPICPSGVSAVKALGLAGQAGQKIFTIDRQAYDTNPNIVNDRLAAHSTATRDRIQQALDAGFEVTIHENPINVNGWSGAGFSVIDPSTGAGGYLIEGGSNGEWQSLAADIGKALLGGALLAIAVMAIPFQIIFLAYGAIFFAIVATVIGMLAGIGAIMAGVDPVTVTLLRATVATILVFGLLAFGAAAVIAPIALGLFLIWLLASLFLEISIVRALNE